MKIKLPIKISCIYITNVFSFYNHNDMDMNGADVMRVLIVLTIWI